MQQQLFYLFVLLLALSACRKDEIITTTTTVVPEPKVSVNAGIYGLVVDTDDAPVPGATVQWGNLSTQTDENGFFRLAHTVVDGRNAQLRVAKNRYWTALPSYSLGDADELDVTIQLRERTLNQSFDAGTSAQLDVDGTTTVSLPAAYITEDGQPYTGEVNAYATYLDPTASDLWDIMPGNLRAVDAASEETLLRTFGMVNVVLETPGGEPLQIDGTATLRMEVPAELQGDAPAAIPLWHFDETSGLWLEEGEARLENGAYVGTVSHFTWWNCDVPQDFVFLEGQLLPSTGDPVYDIRFTVVSNGSFGQLTTDNKGNFAGNVPKDELLLLEILDICGNVVYSEGIGPFDTDTELPLLTFDPGTISIISVSGTLVDCEDTPVTNGYVRISGDFPSQLVIPAADGIFSYTGSVCNQSDVTITGIDLETSKGSTPTTYAYAPTIDAGTVKACELDLTTYIRYNDPDGNPVELGPLFVDLFDQGANTLINLRTVDIDPDNNGTVTYYFAFLIGSSATSDTLAVIVDTDVAIFLTPDLPIFTLSGANAILASDFIEPEATPGFVWTLNMTDLNVYDAFGSGNGTTDMELRVIFE